MDELKHRAGERLEAIHVAAKSVAGNSKSRVQDIAHQTAEAIRKLRDAFHEIWHHELFAESRARVGAWSRDAVQRIRDGTPPLSPVLLYEELVALFKDRVWRRSVMIFICGASLGCGAGLALGLRLAARGPPAGPHARALHTHADQSVLLVEDAVAPGAGPGEVLVRVQAWSVCPVDRCVLRGRGAALRALLARGDVTVGRAFAGVVLDVGADAGPLELGDEVWGCVSEWSGGAACELLAVSGTRVSKRPRGAAADGAAALPWGGALALAALERLRYTPENCKGKRVAICGAASGEGCVLIQLLSAWGARLTVAAPRHAALPLQDLGAHEFVDVAGADERAAASWLALEQHAARRGPWDAVVACAGAGAPPHRPDNTAALLKSTAPRDALVDVRPTALLSDRLVAPFSFIFTACFYTYRILRWAGGMGTHTDWLEDTHRLRDSLEALAKLVDAGQLAPVLDKVYLPQDFECALAHACGEDAIGTTVVRFP